MTIHVVGNAGIDLTFRLDRFPRPGETLNARGLDEGIGGKGANQAVAARRTGAPTMLWAAVGRDAAGGLVRARIAAEGMETGGLVMLDLPTDRSAILVDARAENLIASAVACATAFDPLAVTGLASRLAPGDVVVMQGNLRGAVTAATLAAARAAGARTVLNPSPLDPAGPPPPEHSPLGAKRSERREHAPASESGAISDRPDDSIRSESALALADLIVANRGEAEALTGLAEPAAAAAALRAIAGAEVIVSLGAEGALLLDAAGEMRVAAPRVDAVDATGAGDVLCGVLAGLFAQGWTTRASLAVAVKAAAIAATRPGAMASCPSAAEIGGLIAALQREPGSDGF